MVPLLKVNSVLQLRRKDIKNILMLFQTVSCHHHLNSMCLGHVGVVKGHLINCVIFNYRKVDHLHGNLSMPIYDRTSKHYTAKSIVEVLLDKHLPLKMIATSQPVGVQENLVFVIDLSKLEKPEDI